MPYTTFWLKNGHQTNCTFKSKRSRGLLQVKYKLHTYIRLYVSLFNCYVFKNIDSFNENDT